MSHYTPTHTAEGRKLTRAERKAANKAKFAAEQARRKEERAEARAQARKERIEASIEAKQQRESIRKQEDKRTKERAKATKVVSAIDGGEAMPFEPRMEVPVDVQERKRKPLEHEDLSDYAGLTLEEASRLRFERWMTEQADITLDDCI